VDNHRLNDFKPYAFKTTDYGETWASLAGGLPQDDYVKVIREDPKKAGLLYLGMDRGLFASWDGGKRWVSIRNNLPPVSVRDIKVHPRDNDLIIGTHGRGAWILDDIEPLQKLGDAMQVDAYLFDVRPATRWQMWNRHASLGEGTFAAPNPPDGAFINYYLKEAPEEPVTITITDSSGRKVKELTEKEAKAGVNRTVWDMRHEGPTPLRVMPPGAEGIFAMIERIFGSMGPPAVPGDYTVTMKVGANEHNAQVTIKGDPRIDMSPADYRAQFEAAKALRDLTSRVNGAVDTTLSLRMQLAGLQQQMKMAGAKSEEMKPVAEALDKAMEEVKAIDNRLRQPVMGMMYRQYPRLMEELYMSTIYLVASTSPPTEGQLVVINELKRDAEDLLADVDELVNTTIRDLNEMLGAFPKIMVGPVTE
jgi:hypothetical protein